MIVYRIGKARWSKDLTGEGSRLNGGRWNNIGTACIYTSSSRALSLLEYSAHTPLDLIPRALSFTAYDVPEDKIFVCNESMLPGNWKQVAHSRECKNFGSNLLNHHLIIQLPSIILSYEYNYLINPRHPEFTGLVKINEILDYVYDIRIKY